MGRAVKNEKILNICLIHSFPFMSYYNHPISLFNVPSFRVRNGKEVSVMYKNKGGPTVGGYMNNKDNTRLLKHDDTADVIHFPSSNPTSGCVYYQ